MRFAMFKTKRENTVNIFIKLNYDINYWPFYNGRINTYTSYKCKSTTMMSVLNFIK